MKTKDYPCYLVTCLDDRESWEKSSTRILATRTVFYDLDSALKYKRGIAKSRYAQILPCMFLFKIEK